MMGPGNREYVSDKPKSKDRWDKLSTIMPIVALIVGIAITSWLIPIFQGQWAAQNHQKELELKSDLADQISKAVANMEVAAQTSTNPLYANHTASAYLDFETSKSIIHSKIQAYYNDSRLTKNWDDLSSTVALLANVVAKQPFSDLGWCSRLGGMLTLHALVSENNPLNIDRNATHLFHCDRYFVLGLRDYGRELQTHFPVDSLSIDWNALFYRTTNSSSGSQGFSDSYNILLKDIGRCQENLVESIFKKQIIAIQ